jgi:hypothetical protein
VFELRDELFLFVDHRGHHVADGDNADELVTFKDQKMPTSVFLHQIEAITCRIVGTDLDGVDGHHILDLDRFWILPLPNNFHHQFTFREQAANPGRIGDHHRTIKSWVMSMAASSMDLFSSMVATRRTIIGVIVLIVTPHVKLDIAIIMSPLLKPMAVFQLVVTATLRQYHTSRCCGAASEIAR